VEEATDRDKRSIRTSIEDYLSLRCRTGAVRPPLNLLLLPLEISDNVLQNPKVKELEVLALDMIAITNVSALRPRFPRIFERRINEYFLIQCRASARRHTQFGHCSDE
jgi:hypothetical protein